MTLPANKITIVAAALFIFSSCNNTDKNDLMRSYMLSATFIKLSENTRHQSEIIYSSLQQKAADPATAEKGTIWYSKAMAIQKLSDNMYDYVDTLKNKLMKEAGIEDNNQDAIYTKGYQKVTATFFIEKKKSNELYEKLETYIKNLLAIDQEIQKEFEIRLNPFGLSAAGGAKDKNIFLKVYFNNVTLVESVLVLSNFQTGIRSAEYQLASYCHNKVYVIRECGWGDNHPLPIASISSSYVKAGEQVEITVGIGIMSHYPKPVFTIDNRTIPVNENGVALYKINTSKKAGKYSVPIKVQYTEPDGRLESIMKEIKYEVVKDTTGPKH